MADVTRLPEGAISLTSINKNQLQTEVYASTYELMKTLIRRVDTDAIMRSREEAGTGNRRDPMLVADILSVHQHLLNMFIEEAADAVDELEGQIAHARASGDVVVTNGLGPAEEDDGFEDLTDRLNASIMQAQQQRKRA